MARIVKLSTPRRTKPPKSSLKPPARSPLYYRRASGDLGRGTASRPSNARSARFLTPVREESPLAQGHARHSHSFTDYRDFHLNDDTLYDGLDDANIKNENNDADESDAEDSFFHWEEENTLFFDLMEEDPKASVDDRIENLANSLQTSFDLEGRQVKKDIAETLVPTVNRVKALYGVLDDEVDFAFGKGLLIFNKACKDTEAMAIKEQDELKHAYMASQAKIEELSARLEEAYIHRSQLWVDFEKALDEIVKPTLELLEDMPAKIERRITDIDKRAKGLDGESPSAARRKMKALLSKLS